MEDQAKTFASLRNEASNPLVKLYYEVLNRFHPHDYDAAINAMSGDLRSIIEACNAGFYYLEQTKTITMQHVTAQTATALRDAGFPQPEFATGQIWYNQFGEATFIGRKDCDIHGNTTFFCTSLRTGRTEEMRTTKEDAIFAPTAPDILRELGLGYGLYVSESGNTFVCRELSTIWTDENPAEACAQAWLAKHAQSG